jgi:prepilin-type N-terminal cleavage/methylation domain-containing protein
MGRASTSSKRGFSLIELLVALAVGMLVVGLAIMLFSQGVDATWVVSQRAEMQQDLRAAEDLLLRDVSLAGAGLTSITGQSVALPSALGSPKYGCSTAGCPPNGGVNYPCIGGGCVPTLYPIMPGFALGIKPPGSPVASDLITVVYTDTNLALNCYSGTGTPITFNATGNVLTFTAPTVPLPASCVLPPGVVYPQAVNNTVNGVLPGDLILVGPFGSSYAIGEVTGVAGPVGAPAPGTSAYTLAFANGDTLNMNQSGAANDLTTLKGASGQPGLQANRIFVITYYLQNIPDPLGGTNGDTILYRQVNGQAPVPLVDNIAAMQFTYDTYDSAGALLNAVGDGGESVGTTPNLIRRVNIVHLTIHSQLDGTRGALMATQGFQSFDVQTSISARNASYNQRY